MIASSIGFALVFLTASVFSSLVLGGTVLLGRRALRGLGSGAERRAAFFALVLPPILAAVLALVLAGRSVLGPWLGFSDHCPQHPDHLHLCLHHGAAWAEHAWALASLLAI